MFGFNKKLEFKRPSLFQKKVSKQYCNFYFYIEKGVKQ